MYYIDTLIGGVIGLTCDNSFVPKLSVENFKFVQDNFSRPDLTISVPSKSIICTTLRFTAEVAPISCCQPLFDDAWIA